MHHVRKIETEPLSAGLWSCACAEQEARHLAGLLGKNGDTLESLRELIAVSPRVEALLRAFAQKHPESQRGIEKMLAYRRRVGEEFERLLSGVDPVTSAPQNQIESKPAIEAEVVGPIKAEHPDHRNA